jgi:hypothetical protein
MVSAIHGPKIGASTEGKKVGTLAAGSWTSGILLTKYVNRNLIIRKITKHKKKFGLKQKTNWYREINEQKERKTKTNKQNNSDWKDMLEINDLSELTATGTASNSLVQAVLSRHHRKNDDYTSRSLLRFAVSPLDECGNRTLK